MRDPQSSKAYVMLLKLSLKDVGPAPALELAPLPRLNLITGDNGLGKTFFLDIAWWALTRTWAGNPAAPHRGKGVKPMISCRLRGQKKAVDSENPFDFSLQAWKPKHGRPPNPGMVLYARVDGSFSVWDPARNYWKIAPSLGVHQPDRPAAYHFNSADVWNELKSPDGKILCNGLIRDWALWQARQSDEFKQLVAALREMSPSADEVLEPGELVRIAIDEAREMPTIKSAYGDDVPLIHASAGVKRIIALAYLLVWTWREHVQASKLLNKDPENQIIFLIDEIEAHLHPRWQRTILRSLLNVVHALQGTTNVAVQVLAVTHSPMVLASLEPLFDKEKDSLFHIELVRSNGNTKPKVELERLEWVRRGDANSWLVSDIFDLREARSLEAEQALEAAKHLMRKKDATKAEYIQVQNALNKSMPSVDAFFIRWNFWAKQAGFDS